MFDIGNGALRVVSFVDWASDILYTIAGEQIKLGFYHSTALFFRCADDQFRCAFASPNRARRFFNEISGFFAGRRSGKPNSF
jgi:hypothetical protein